VKAKDGIPAQDRTGISGLGNHGSIH